MKLGEVPGARLPLLTGPELFLHLELFGLAAVATMELTGVGIAFDRLNRIARAGDAPAIRTIRNCLLVGPVPG